MLSDIDILKHRLEEVIVLRREVEEWKIKYGKLQSESQDWLRIKQ